MPLLPDVKFTLLHSSSTPPASNNDCPYRINNASIVFMLEIQGVKVLFTGDANGKERSEPSPGTPGHIEKMLLDLEAQHPGLLKADILKVPHHGSETASTQALIDKVNPQFVIISASTKHHLPKLSTLLRYENGVRAILKTDKNLENDKDHIICSGGPVVSLTCNYKIVLEN
jgi:competence protein ComEC